MTDKKRVVTTSARRTARKTSAEFNFSAEMLPVIETGSETISSYRQTAWEAFQRLEMPKTTEEAWRRTDIRGLRADSFAIAKADPTDASVPAELLKPLVGEGHGGQITMQAGKTEIYLDPDLAAKGVVFTNLRTALSQHPEVVEKILGQIVAVDEDIFSALTAAFAEDGVLLYVPRGVQIEDPLHSVLWGPGASRAYFSHLLVYLDEQSSATYVHEYASPDESDQSLHTGIVEIFVGKAARLQFVEFQSWGRHVWNFTHERAKVERDANLDWIFGAIGTHLTKNFSEIDLVGEGSTGRMSGFYFTDGIQHLDHDTQQNHHAPHTTSDLLFKGALKDHSRSVWQGMIYVAPGAQKTDGYQSNPNLILDKTARADSIPGLEIMADDVRCTHGATAGKIDPTEVFYLNSRGIPTEDAERLIVEGFFDPVMQRIPFEGVRQRLQQAIIDKLA
ncbi:MAG: Fe-S cluster assembly protein SufD [Anaerolineales bacterium]|nr:Fe-S cluster assembly protein SufD [Anaerolineales bacterium]